MVILGTNSISLHLAPGIHDCSHDTCICSGYQKRHGACSSSSRNVSFLTRSSDAMMGMNGVWSARCCTSIEAQASTEATYISARRLWSYLQETLLLFTPGTSWAVMSMLLKFLPTSQKQPKEAETPSPPPTEYADAKAEKASLEKHHLGADEVSLKTTVLDASDQDPDLNPGTLTFEEGTCMHYHSLQTFPYISRRCCRWYGSPSRCLHLYPSHVRFIPWDLPFFEPHPWQRWQDHWYWDLFYTFFNPGVRWFSWRIANAMAPWACHVLLWPVRLAGVRNHVPKKWRREGILGGCVQETKASGDRFLCFQCYPTWFHSIRMYCVYSY